MISEKKLPINDLFCCHLFLIVSVLQVMNAIYRSELNKLLVNICKLMLVSSQILISHAKEILSLPLSKSTKNHHHFVWRTIYMYTLRGTSIVAILSLTISRIYSAVNVLCWHRAYITNDYIKHTQFCFVPEEEHR